MSQRPPHNPDTAASRGPGARDGRQALARQQQRLHLFTHRAAAIQFSLPIDWSGLYDRRKRQHQHCSEYFLHDWSTLSKEGSRTEFSARAPKRPRVPVRKSMQSGGRRGARERTTPLQAEYELAGCGVGYLLRPS